MIGDTLSIIGLIYYLLKHYTNIYIFIGKEYNDVIDYLNNYFRFDPHFNRNIFITSDPEQLINNGKYGEFDICNFDTSFLDLIKGFSPWHKPSFEFIDLKNIDSRYYFNSINPFYNQLNIPLEYQTNPNSKLPINHREPNHLIYYKLLGLNNNVRLNYFNYYRNLEVEKQYSIDILKKYNLKLNDKYNIINCPFEIVPSSIYDYIDNDYPLINISLTAPCVGYLISLVENAESVHFIEGCNVNFFYHCQYKKIFNYNKIINFHIHLRNRDWKWLNLDYAWKMMSEPKLENWNFIF